MILAAFERFSIERSSTQRCYASGFYQSSRQNPARFLKILFPDKL